MSLLPCPQQYIQSCASDQPEAISYKVLPAPCWHCGAKAVHEHHVCRRSFLTGNKDWVWLYDELVWNKVPLCLPCHEKIERIEAWIVYEPGVGFAWNDQLPDDGLTKAGEEEGGETASGVSPASVSPGLTDGEEGIVASSLVAGPTGIGSGSPSVSPGEKCDSCGRRVPHPRKKDSPKSKVIAFRIPTDDAPSIEKAWEDRADRMGILTEPYWRRTYLDIAGVIIDNLSTDTLHNIVADYRGQD